ncbi:sodium:solute symporter [Gimesia chilikensis]|uniref:sodium:solute symporter family protein n=1 Tax=Gimesia chilikensis TaxID=2605989 RepID=UPI00118B2797|nr:sodium:solute symporter family protein [Gimesia chilikensis]QDT82558.1 Sodium/glucose cotransporter [Gimesia chilikensis]
MYDTNFTLLDWSIVVCYLLSSIVIGLWANRYVGNLSDYLVAGRKLRLRLALATMTGTELGLVTVMYMAELGFTQQYASLYLAFLEAGAVLLIGLTGFVVYRLRQSSIMTIPEYYEQRYSQSVRVVGATVMVVSGVLNMGLFLKAGSQFLTAVSGLQDEMYLKLIMTGLLLLVLFYTVLGGMVSVVITDLIQFLILGTGMVIVTGVVFWSIGWDGLSAIVTEQNGYFDPFHPENNSGNGNPIGWMQIVQMAIVIGSAALLWPTSAARTLSCQSAEVAQKLYSLSSISFLARRALPVFWGIGTFAFFASQPELFQEFHQAVETNASITSLSAMPLFLAKVVPTGLLGLVTAGMIAAFMSTHDSYLLCWSGVITQDIIAPVAGPMSQRSRILTTRISIFVIGAMLLTWGLWYEVSSDLWGYLAVTGAVYLSGAIPTVVGGLYWKRGSRAGALAAILGGLSGLLAMGPCVDLINKLFATSLNGTHLTLLTFAFSSVAYIVFSLLIPDRRVETSPNVSVNPA